MPYYPDQHQRRSIRVPGYDYSTAGAYFVTICTEGRVCRFGDVSAGGMRLNDAGTGVVSWWSELGNRFPSVHPGEMVVMPNHLHGVLYLHTRGPVGAALRGCPPSPPTECSPDAPAASARSPNLEGAVAEGAHTGAPLPDVVRWFKTMTTNAYIRGVRENGWMRFEGRLWQRNYFERVLRDEGRLARARVYIAENPARWAQDPERPR